MRISQKEFEFLKKSKHMKNPSRKGGSQVERAIQNSIIQWLKLQRDLEAEVIDNKGTWVRDPSRPGGGYFKGSGTCRGFPDIIGWFHEGFPQIFFIEVKSPGGKLSKHQKEFETRCLDSNASHKKAESLDDAMEFIEILRLMRGYKP